MKDLARLLALEFAGVCAETCQANRFHAFSISSAPGRASEESLTPDAEVDALRDASRTL